MAKHRFTLSWVLGIGIVLLFLVFSFFRIPFFETLETLVYDAEMRFTQTGEWGEGQVVLVEIDRKSLEKLGAWPWPRHVIAEMISLLTSRGAKVVGLNLALGEREFNQGLKEVKAFREKFEAFSFSKKDVAVSPWIMDNLKELEQNLDSDRRLVESIQQNGNVIIPVFPGGGSDPVGAEKGVDPVPAKSFLSDAGVSGSVKQRLSIQQLSLPYPELAQVVLGLGHSSLSPEERMEGRSHPLFVSYRGSLLPSFPLRLAIAFLGQQPRQVLVEENQIRLAGFSMPICDGEMLIKFLNPPAGFYRYSFVDVLQAKGVPPVVKGKIVLVGFGPDRKTGIPTPVGPRMPETEFWAHILNNILAKSFIVRPTDMLYLEMLMVGLAGALGTFLFPRMGRLGRLGGMLGLTALVLATGTILFSYGIWFKTTYAAGCLVVSYFAVCLSHLSGMEGMTKESIETNRLLGLSFQGQGLLDLALDKFRKLPLDQETKDLIYNLGLEYEQRRMINKALAAYETINRGGGFRDLDERIPRLKESEKSSTLGGHVKIAEGRALGESMATEARNRVGRFEIIQQLGKGSMGLVYKALDPKINRLLAIKTIRFSDEFDEDVIQEIKERFFREAEIAGRLSHPSIVTIYDVGEDRDLTYMAMEFLEGNDLEKFIVKMNLLPMRRVLDVVGSVADALDFAHKAEVIHRDIKPANIMLLRSGGVKVTDFGIAKAISSSRTKTGVILGTPNYMSPEQIMGQKIDPRSDIFSLGVLFYQLLTGELPFHGDNLSSLLYQITQVKHPPIRNYNPKIPRACEQIIDKALTKNPNERFKSAGEMGKLIKLVGSKLDQLRKKQLGDSEPVSKA